MKKHYLLIVLLLCLCKTYGQEPIQEAFVTRTYVNVDDAWSEINFSRMIDIYSNRTGQLKISNAEFLKELSNGKANMLENSAYITAEFTSQVQTKTKTDKNGLLNLTYEGKLVFKTHDGTYAPTAVIVFIINQADVIGLKILNKENRKEMAVDLEVKS
ncbi:hypothetical protein [Flavobacterium aquicola]|uniref:Lipocalin-like protein n=1 Tax=Flavobacterium aquicola TaxID=1682742 RepID=A0A3E0E406_9FLAO|nr:hypothetical protein [Flavobacterium aquicola]REG92941.1 hypothetical protein C8P67_11437 [Flavobacterium aquicola]